LPVPRLQPLGGVVGVVVRVEVEVREGGEGVGGTENPRVFERVLTSVALKATTATS